VTALLSFSFLAVCPGFYFRPHYFVLLLPAVAILAGLAVGALTRTRTTWIPASVFAAAVLLSLLQQRAFFFEMTPLEACRAVYERNPFPEAAVVGKYIAEHTAPDARIAVLGSEPEIYFHARRRSATGYLYTFAMTEKQPYAQAMQEELIRQIEASLPDYLVFSPLWAAEKERMSVPRVVEGWLAGFLQRNYDPDGLVEVLSESRTESTWGPGVARRPPRSGIFLLVLKKRQ
jgi:hypothetical protein